MPKKTKVADIYQKRGSVYRNEKTFGEKVGEFVVGVVGLLIVFAIIGVIV